MTDIATATPALTATEQLRLYRTRHRIEVDRSPGWDRCDTDGIPVYQVLSRTRWQHDPDELRRLELRAVREAAEAHQEAVLAHLREEGEAIYRSLEAENAYFRAHENDVESQWCSQDGHAPGCPCEAGGDPVLIVGSYGGGIVVADLAS